MLYFCFITMPNLVPLGLAIIVQKTFGPRQPDPVSHDGINMSNSVDVSYSRSK